MKNINMNTTKSPEFDGWRWVSFCIPYVRLCPLRKMFIAKRWRVCSSNVWQRKDITENTQEHEANKPYHASRKSGFLNIKNVHLISQGGNNAHFYSTLFACRSVVGFLSRIIWHWWRINYCPNLGLSIADDRRAWAIADVRGIRNFIWPLWLPDSSAQRHHKLGNIEWNAVKVLAPDGHDFGLYPSGLFIGAWSWGIR